MPLTASNSVGVGASVLDITIFDTGSSVVREVWTNVPGVNISDIPLTTPPNSIAALGGLEGLTDYGDNSINFSLRVWTCTKTHAPLVLKSDLYFSLFKIFGENGIELPFPQRDLHLRSSDVPLFRDGV